MLYWSLQGDGNWGFQIDPLICNMYSCLIFPIIFQDWNLFVSDELFMTRLEDLESYLALKEGRKRGYYSYTELLFLLEMVDFLSAARSFFTVIIILKFLTFPLFCGRTLVCQKHKLRFANNVLGHSLNGSSAALKKSLQEWEVLLFKKDLKMLIFLTFSLSFSAYLGKFLEFVLFYFMKQTSRSSPIRT